MSREEEEGQGGKASKSEQEREGMRGWQELGLTAGDRLSQRPSLASTTTPPCGGRGIVLMDGRMMIGDRAWSWCHGYMLMFYLVLYLYEHG